ncbi:MAG: AI-2E family transporter [Bacteroidota bacterium]|uniref:AI-2E family transporter n=1 Tax=Nonlabens tegetincola TaxID=323273 RepID=UPI000A20B5F1|nr:AI-2E family transporter [Nonlabens tegetincola]ARN71749.1 AI-2E family transporter [Nonlabens tegetincola]MEE2802236.1 AI-2E family transporter [Bacteroidota bacterium]
MSNRIPPETIRQLFILTVIVALLILISKEMMVYIGGIMGAVTLYVILEPLQIKLEKKNWNASLTAGLLLLLTFIALVIPLAGMSYLLSSRVKTALDNSNKIAETIKSELVKLEELTSMSFSDSINMEAIQDWIATHIQDIASSGFQTIFSISVMFFILYFMLINRKKWKEAILIYLPLKKRNIELLGKESNNLVKSNAIGIPLVALLQGIVALIGYFIFGVENPFFWFVITVIGSMIPFVGTALGIIPVAALLFAKGDTGAAIGILIYGAAVVGATDNVFRLIVQQKLADIHPVVTLIGVLVGVPLFGFIGLVFGPLLVSLLLLIIKIYKNEYGKDEGVI